MARSASRPTRSAPRRSAGKGRGNATSRSGGAKRASRSAAGTASRRTNANAPKPLHRLRLMRFVANLRSRGLGYAEFREGLERAEIELDNESAYGLLLTDPATFTEFVNIARECLDD